MDENIINGIEEYLKSEDFSAECKKQFEEYDKDQSGFLEKGEVKNILKNLASSFPDDSGKTFEVTDKDVEDAMKDLDTNSDGKLSLEEFKQLAEITFMAALAVEVGNKDQKDPI